MRSVTASGVVRKSTGAWQPSARSARPRSRPSASGSATSMTTAPGRSSTCLRAVPPLRTAVTSKPASTSAWRSRVRSSSSPTTTSTRVAAEESLTATWCVRRPDVNLNSCGGRRPPVVHPTARRARHVAAEPLRVSRDRRTGRPQPRERRHEQVRGELEAERIGERVARQPALEDVEARDVVAALAGDLAGGHPVRGADEPELARLDDLVGGEHDDDLVARRLDPPAELGLALLVVADRLVLAQRGDHPGDARPERLAQLVECDAALLDDVVQQPRGDDLVAVAGAVQQQRDLERVHDERGAVGLALLGGVRLDRTRRGARRHRQAGDEEREIAVGGHGAMVPHARARVVIVPNRRRSSSAGYQPSERIFAPADTTSTSAAT